jgi:hypothetical protein
MPEQSMALLIIRRTNHLKSGLSNSIVPSLIVAQGLLGSITKFIMLSNYLASQDLLKDLVILPALGHR